MASADNNKGFFTGEELIIRDSYKVDINGVVYDETDTIIGTQFQRANININNRFKIIPNKLFFEINNHKFNTFLMWKLRITSGINNNFIYEIPIVYINTTFDDQTFLTKYTNLENKLRTLDIIQYQESSLCELNFDNTVDWKIAVSNETSGVFADEVKVKTSGKTLLEVGVNSKINTHIGVDENFYYTHGEIINKNNFKMIFSEHSDVWKIISPIDDVALTNNKKYPHVGIYKTTTRNIVGTSKYELHDTEPVISVSKFTEEYDSANGIYRSVGYLSTGEYMFRNENNWLFFKKSDAWTIQNSSKHPSYIIEMEYNIPQSGVYTDEPGLVSVFANFAIEFDFEDNRDFIGVDTDRLELSSRGGDNIVYDALGNEKPNTEDVSLEIGIDCIYAEKHTSYFHSIPCKSSATTTGFSRYGDLIINSDLEIYNDTDSDILRVGVETTKTNNLSKNYTSVDIKLPDEENTLSYVDEFFYTNTFKSGIKYKIGDSSASCV